MIHHTVNKHEWRFGMGVSAGCCSHGPLEDEETHGTPWLEAGSPAHEALIGVVLNARLMHNVHHYVHFR